MDIPKQYIIPPSNLFPDIILTGTKFLKQTNTGKVEKDDLIENKIN